MDEAIKAEIERLHDEDRRQNKRLEMLEGLVRETQSLALSVYGLAKDMEQMLHEQRDQGRRLDALKFREDLENNLFYLQECMKNLQPPKPNWI